MKLTAESTVINDDKLNTNIDNAQTTADEAKQIADDTAQYFWFTSSGSDTGAHISEQTQAQFIANPSGGNLLARSNGIAVRDGLTELATFTGTDARIGDASGGNVYIDNNSIDIRDGTDVLATFGADGMQIGEDEKKHIGITSDTFNVYDDNGTVPFSVSTSGSSKSATTRRFTSISGTNGGYSEEITQIFLKGTITDNRVYFGVDDTAKPTDFSQYVEDPTTTAKSVTVNGVICYVQYVADSVLQVIYRNTTTIRKYVGCKMTETYRETEVRVNGATFTPKSETPTIIDDIGVVKYDGNTFVLTYGRIAMLYLSVYNTSSVSAGGIIYKGALLNYAPMAVTSLTGIYGNNKQMIGTLNATGDILLYNATGTSLVTSESTPITLKATYIFEQ